MERVILMSSLPAATRLHAERMSSGEEIITQQVAAQLLTLDTLPDFTSVTPWYAPGTRVS